MKNLRQLKQKVNMRRLSLEHPHGVGQVGMPCTAGQGRRPARVLLFLLLPNSISCPIWKANSGTRDQCTRAAGPYPCPPVGPPTWAQAFQQVILELRAAPFRWRRSDATAARVKGMCVGGAVRSLIIFGLFSCRTVWVKKKNERRLYIFDRTPLVPLVVSHMVSLTGALCGRSFTAQQCSALGLSLRCQFWLISRRHPSLIHDVVWGLGISLAFEWRWRFDWRSRWMIYFFCSLLLRKCSCFGAGSGGLQLHNCSDPHPYTS